MKRRSVTAVYDKLHKGGVYTCMAMTVLGAYWVGYGIYNYYVNVKPLRMAEVEKLNLELLREGASEGMIDNAKLIG